MDLRALLDAEVIQTRDGHSQTMERSLPVVADGGRRRMAVLQTSLQLIDHGESAMQSLRAPPPSMMNDPAMQTPQRHGDDQNSHGSDGDDVQPMDAAEARIQPEYSVALELAMWRKMEEQRFMVALAEKEESVLRGLADEWKVRERERNTIMKRYV